MENINNDAARFKAGEDYQREQTRFMESENRLINHGPSRGLANEMWNMINATNLALANQAKEAAKHE
jgi:hypothetical protein|tara:strand:- start:832 stop:1032 length:201 start_codon:yes stop_codon:yes gene_type:complete